MADRRDIREAFYAELEDAISNLAFIDGSDISQEMPNSEEQLPRIVHNDDYREVPMNQGSEGPHEVETDSQGRTERIIFYSMMQAQFGVVAVHHNEQEKEDIYEAIRRHFERYEHAWWDESDIHTDVHDVNVQDATSTDDEDSEPTTRGDRILVRLGYKRDYVVAREDIADGSEDATYGSNIEEVTHRMDADNDDTTDETYTTT